MKEKIPAATGDKKRKIAKFKGLFGGKYGEKAYIWRIGFRNY